MKKFDLPLHIQALFKPDTYPHPVETITMIQTHISWVFLTGGYAYKLKKPLDLGFLNFSTLSKRHYYCEQELSLNRRLTDDVYLDVLPLCKQGQHYNINGSGEVVDYCLKMRQFNQSGLFEQQLDNNQFDPAWMDQLALSTAVFHAQQQSTVQFGQPSLLAEHIQTNLDIAREHTGEILHANTIAALEAFATESLQIHHERLLKRQRDGFIRPCHGDLHLKNVTLIHNSPTIFDCIEFNDEYRIIDTINDIAFLIMDCDAHHRPDLGFRFLSRYLEQTNDYSGLTLLKLYLFYRATVRGKVCSLLAIELSDKDKRQQQFEEAKHYFDLASTYTIKKRARLFVVGGLSGSGKSHLALLACGKEHAIIIRSDATRKRIASDYPVLELYSDEMHRITFSTMFNAARTALEAGFSVILDATFLHPDNRKQAFELAQQCDVPLHFFWLEIKESQLRSQIKQRTSAANDISDADLSVLDQQLSHYQRPAEAWIQFLSSSNSWPSIT